MKTQQIDELTTTTIAYGCMHVGGAWNTEPTTNDEINRAFACFDAALESGINFFDHADIYTIGKSEKVFGKYLQLHKELRDKIVIQSKCGIRFGGDPNPDSPGRYDFSYDYIVWSAENILKRLGIETLDILLLHRPDPLVEPEEVGRAFAHLKESGKVKKFGVSNHSGSQIELLQRYCDEKITVNQIELNLLHNDSINEGVTVNQPTPSQNLRAQSVIDYCRLNDITIQAWSPIAKGIVSDDYAVANSITLQEVRSVVQPLSQKYGVSYEAIFIAWLLRHPAKIQPVLGTTNPDRIKSCVRGADIELTREEWYKLFVAARGGRMP